MNRVIVGETHWTWVWKLSHFPKAGGQSEVGNAAIEESSTLIEAIASVAGVEDTRIRLPRRKLPDTISILTPGESTPTRFHLTGEPRIPYTIDDSFELVICDAPVCCQNHEATIVIEAGWQIESGNGIRIVTHENARRRFGTAPEAFTAGATLDATRLRPVLYVLGGGGAVWLTSADRGEFWQDDAFTDWKKAIALVTEIVTNGILAQREISPCAAMEQWHEHRTFHQT